ncbi:MAG: formylmethanofuran dehydrogenase [Nitrospiraceae bacterium]|nr:MAG: formylmethanofuran dehydrogenase [Nitrospiraceae bacterium]
MDFEKLLDESVKTHGHLCPGQVLGVRLSMLGLKLIGISDPKGIDRKKLISYVEIDRCATDAIQSVTGCSLGKRSLKFLDYGKMAATFVNTETGKAVRIIAMEDSKDRAKNYFPDIEDKYKCQLEAYKVMPDEELFEWKEVEVRVPEADMPGRPLRRIRCSKCEEYVQDSRDVTLDGKLLCKACAQGAYYR